MNNTNGRFNSWKHIYEGYTVVINNKVDQNRILGAELLVWGTVTNDDNFENNVWMRSAVFGERMWNAKMMATYELVGAMVKVQRALEAAGINVSPLTS